MMIAVYILAGIACLVLFTLTVDGLCAFDGEPPVFGWRL
jgi:hypothetical protein